MPGVIDLQRERERENHPSAGMKRDGSSSTDMNGCGPQRQILSLTWIRHGGVHVTFTFVAHVLTQYEQLITKRRTLANTRN